MEEAQERLTAGGLSAGREPVEGVQALRFVKSGLKAGCMNQSLQREEENGCPAGLKGLLGFRGRFLRVGEGPPALLWDETKRGCVGEREGVCGGVFGCSTAKFHSHYLGSGES